MEDRAGPHHRLALPEKRFDVEEIAIPQERLQGCDLGIGAQNKDAIKPRFFSDLSGIDLEHLLALDFLLLAQIASIGRVTHKSLVAAFQLGIEPGDNRLAVL